MKKKKKRSKKSEMCSDKVKERRDGNQRREDESQLFLVSPSFFGR